MGTIATNNSDSDLILRYKATDDKSIIGCLFERYSHLVYGVCMKYLKNEADAEDAQMQIFEKLLTDLKRHEIVQFKGWLHTVAKNHCLMHIRSEKTLSAKEQELKADFKSFVEPDTELYLDDSLEKEQQLRQMEKAIEELDGDQKTCIDLFYLKEKSYMEIVEITGYSLNSVKSHLQNGKRNIRIFLGR